MNGGITNISCPECKDRVETSVPCSADIASIIANPENDTHGIDRTAMERSRENKLQCPNGHTLSILYDW